MFMIIAVFLQKFYQRPMKHILHNIKACFLLLLLIATTLPVMAQKSGNKPFTVVIDAGHGGVDPGALGRKSKEKDINFKVSNLLGDMIKEAYPEVKVIYTRTTDVKIPLARRADIANKANANLFISIHSNASKNRSANGCQTFTLGAGSDAEAKAAAMYENEVILSEENFEETYKGFDPRSSESYIIFELMRSHDMEQSVKLAEMVQRGMVKSSALNDRGVSSAGFLVLHRTVMPSILVELGFISNKSDENFIGSEEGQNKLVKGLFNGFAEYYELYGKGKENMKKAEEERKVAQKKEETAAAKKKEEPAPKKKKEDTKKKKEEAKNKKAENNNKAQAVNKEAKKNDGKPIFKIQVLASERKLRSNDECFNGLEVECYKDNGIYKYTYGESDSYDDIVKQKKEIAEKFKGAFIIAFLNGERISTNEAIGLYKKQKK